MLIFLNFVFIKESNKKVQKSVYYYDFWRSCDTEDCSNDAENTEINDSLTYRIQLF